ncbi:MAG: hypothetical protein ABI178_14595, partial [Rhodanobacter sp.]
SSDQAHSWTRISPDLARQTWKTPATVGKYANKVKPGPQGSITALSASALDVNVLWAGTDDGNVQVTMDGGTHWSNVTPPAIKPWTRIYNIEAGHFDAKTAYAAANTMRIDDMNPHLWRTHDGGKTWTEINHGISPGVLTNTIREDPRKPGLLYAGTDTQVWVSFDDGDHWQSLRLDMPAVSVRDLQVKDDAKCGCADLIAGTHGRGFYILDDVTPLRQVADARKAGTAYLFKPQTATRVRLVTYDSMPFPPEIPSGENPPNGAIIDYYLASDATGPLSIDILDQAGNVVRTYLSELKRNPDPALDPAAYNKVCQAKPDSPDCSIPLYWPSPIKSMPTSAGMHRISWSLRYQPLAQERSPIQRPIVIPHRSSVVPSSPWAPPGKYTVRLTVGGETYTQPLTVRLDPRVITPAAALAQSEKLSVEMYELARSTLMAYGQAQELVQELGKLESTEPAASKSFKASVDAVAHGSGPRGYGLPYPTPATLKDVSDAALAASLALETADTAPTAAQIEACTQARQKAQSVMAKWDKVKGTGLSAFNARLTSKGHPALALPPLRMPAPLPSDENGNLMEREQ